MLRRRHIGREQTRNRIEGTLRGSPPAISERGLIGDLRTAAQTWWIVQGQTGGNEGGLFVRVVWGTLPAARAAHTLDRQTGPRRCGVQHLSPAAARYHLPPFTTLIYVIVYVPGVGLTGWGFIWVIIALLLDMGHWTASYTQRDQIPGRR